MKIIKHLFLLLFISQLNAQLYIPSERTLFVSDTDSIYVDFELVNEGVVQFGTTVDATGSLFIDSGLNNSSGSLTLNNSSLHLGSDQSRASGNHDLIFNDNEDTFKYVTLGKDTGTYTISSSSGGALNITTTFTVNSGTLNANDKAILKSTSFDNTAIVPESMAGTVNGIRVERFIPGERAFRILASPVDTDNSIFDNWQQEGLNPGDPDYRPNVGTHITGGAASDGFDQNASGNPSMITFDITNQAWDPITDNTNVRKLDNSVAYFILVRGDRSVDLSIDDSNSPETTLEQTGSLHIGAKTQTYSLATPSETFVAIANPYQAPVDMNDVIGASDTFFKNQIWIWNQIDDSSGQWVNLDDLSDPSSGTNIPGSNVTEDLQPGQGAFIQTQSSNVANSVDLDFEESDKEDSASLTDTFSDNNTGLLNLDGYLRLGLYNMNATPFVDMAYDGIVIKFDNQYSNSVDDFDGAKLFNEEENLAVILNNNYLSFNNRKLPTSVDEVIDLSMFALDESQYVFSVEKEGLSSLPNGILLWDEYLDTYTALNDQELINFSVDSSIPESSAVDRFAIVFKDQSLVTDDNVLSDIQVYPNPIIRDQVNIQFPTTIKNSLTEIEIHSINGQLILKKDLVETPDKLQLKNLNFPSGVYLLNIKNNNLTKTIKLIKK